MAKKKVLCICAWGNSRSAALAWQLKNKEFNYDAIPIGVHSANPDTLDLLCEWADEIVVMMKVFANNVQPQYKHKIKVCEVGPDRWVNPTNPELVKIVKDWAEKEMK